MSKIILGLCISIGFVSSAFAKDLYPDAKRDRPQILKAAQMNNIPMENLEFPLHKQVVTGTLTAISKIPELVGYVFGSDEGFATLHIIQFTLNGQKFTCGAMTTLKPNNDVYVDVSNCGENHSDWLDNDTLIPTTKVN